MMYNGVIISNLNLIYGVEKYTFNALRIENLSKSWVVVDFIAIKTDFASKW